MVEQQMEAIRTLERDRFRAMVDGDGEALDVLLSDNVYYVHTNGKRESKQQFIDAILAGRRRYRQIEVQSQEVMPVGGDAFVVTGRVIVELEANNGGIVFPIAYTSLQARESGQWRLLAWHATRCATET
ncbi:nuclear transport factor 2 family protein [Burkholderia sp. 22PA0099]|uniref:nuclear transport factor 2 family protein n=1 Tax=unclassified Burkholderia TaxID=2613784 RepID=UPI0039C3F86D